MEPNSGVTIIIVFLGGLIALSVLFWVLRLLWEIIRSPTAMAILIALLALTISLMAVRMTSG
jgi:hypothetical protein